MWQNVTVCTNSGPLLYISILEGLQGVYHSAKNPNVRVLQYTTSHNDAWEQP